MSVFRRLSLCLKPAGKVQEIFLREHGSHGCVRSHFTWITHQRRQFSRSSSCAFKRTFLCRHCVHWRFGQWRMCGDDEGEMNVRSMISDILIRLDVHPLVSQASHPSCRPQNPCFKKYKRERTRERGKVKKKCQVWDARANRYDCRVDVSAQMSNRTE